jgi:AcrR family transcriptional regulator
MGAASRRGYEHFTVATVAARARTSKPVLYRRWKTREGLLRATARHRGTADAPAIPDTGTLRGDLLALPAHANTTRNPMAALTATVASASFSPRRRGRPAGRRERQESRRG